MCGIFGQISQSKINRKKLDKLVKHSEQRGVDSSGLIYNNNNKYKIYRADYNIKKLIKSVMPYDSNIVLGHSRLITNGLNDNQPVVRGDICVIHNGIITNEKNIWDQLSVERKYQIDSEVIVAIAEEHLKNDGKISEIQKKVFSLCKGIIACALVLPNKGKLVLFSNNGSLYAGYLGSDIYFASENYSLYQIGCSDIKQIKENSLILDIPTTDKKLSIIDDNHRIENLIPEFKFHKSEEKLLEYAILNLKRCTKCILPETMPFIIFDEEGVCNYCHNYQMKNIAKPKEELFKLVESYRKKGDIFDCIVPFSGGRDSSYGLHLIVNELKMKPITYTYDWGMVTDLGRRNISQVCAELGVENIIVAANISQKRKNIKMNLDAWLKSPHLGMMAMLTAGDKHFFRHVESIKNQTGIDLNLWGVNPLEQTHFKTGFLGIKPDFEEDKVYTNGIIKQLRYHTKRFKAMTESMGYFNRSIWDTLSGEYYRSFTKKQHYYHIFDYWTWNEGTVNNTLINQYGWETAIDTSTTWRIGDGTAGFYNYVYYTVAGFTEHDTFRSNQIKRKLNKRLLIMIFLIILIWIYTGMGKRVKK
jgi:glutamine---fructose-6-phosphate transaminase (isomerizing)